MENYSFADEREGLKPLKILRLGIVEKKTKNHQHLG